ncbi:hypothetical protein [Synechococcus sp. NOUM97013]|uniref:hypothetical protein n=1 Tax=Synechococcus sp. NOUM97013 TaxID=1442555 RepID=UPI0016456C89|nr:hypothetical protein [Synechococcus sp. NOUM97013]
MRIGRIPGQRPQGSSWAHVIASHSTNSHGSESDSIQLVVIELVIVVYLPEGAPHLIDSHRHPLLSSGLHHAANRGIRACGHQLLEHLLHRSRHPITQYLVLFQEWHHQSSAEWHGSTKSRCRTEQMTERFAVAGAACVMSSLTKSAKGSMS